MDTYYNALAINIQPTGAPTVAMKVLHNTLNMCMCDLPDMNALISWASGMHIRQIPHASCYYYIRYFTHHVIVLIICYLTLRGTFLMLQNQCMIIL